MLTNFGDKTLDHQVVQDMACDVGCTTTKTLSDYVLYDFSMDKAGDRKFLSNVYTNLLKQASSDGIISLTEDYFDGNPIRISPRRGGGSASSGPNQRKSGKWQITVYVQSYEYGGEYQAGDYKHLWFYGDSGDAINSLGVHEPLHEQYPGNGNHPIIDPIVLDPKKNPAIGLATPEYIEHTKRRMKRNARKKKKG